MLEADFQQLIQQTSKYDLDALETDVWAGIEANIRTARTTKTVVAWQAFVVALVLFSGAATGNLFAKGSIEGAVEFDVFSPDTGIAPSTLLLGHKA